MKCTKIYNARAQLLSCSLNLLFGDVAVAVAVVVCLSSPLIPCFPGRMKGGAVRLSNVAYTTSQIKQSEFASKWWRLLNKFKTILRSL